MFDPAYFEVNHNGRRIYKPRTDSELIRLGHPLMQRALGVLRRQMWEAKEGSLARWTVEQGGLEPGMDSVLLLYLLVEATNKFREVAHQEMYVLPFEIRGYRLIDIDKELWEQLQRRDYHSLSDPALKQVTNRLRDLWVNHHEPIHARVLQEREAWRTQLQERMQDRLRHERQAERRAFDLRLRELERQRQPHYLQTLRRDIEKQRQRLLQGVLPLDELEQQQQEQQQRLQEMEWQLEHNYIDSMKHVVEREQERVLTQVLPQRYTLATVDVQPLAIRYLVNESGG